jgi:hypothetical protein
MNSNYIINLKRNIKDNLNNILFRLENEREERNKDSFQNETTFIDTSEFKEINFSKNYDSDLNSTIQKIITNILSTNQKQNVFFTGTNQTINNDNMFQFIELFLKSEKVVLSSNIKGLLDDFSLKDYIVFLSSFWTCHKNQSLLSVNL